MHRFYLPPHTCRGPVLFLTGGEAHHAQHVLRVEPEEEVLVLDGAGQECLCGVEAVAKEQLKLKVLERRSSPPPPFQITLVQALPKGKIIEAIIAKATELGAWRLVPLLTERVVTHLDAAEAARKALKWQAIAVEALKQCGSPWLPRIETPVTPAQFLERKEACELPLMGSLQKGSKHPREYFRQFQQNNGRNPVCVSVWIGPEGDFTRDEMDLIIRAGALPISLGPLVLRVETAAIYCLSILNYELRAA
ncbi:MAG TPA: RsmE family RNA methyltransferase [Verrucomicrobiae bacterium]|nr:RsmE family RNA methyltransferase [Verrucomicrobiae bacterium]